MIRPEASRQIKFKAKFCNPIFLENHCQLVWVDVSSAQSVSKKSICTVIESKLFIFIAALIRLINQLSISKMNKLMFYFINFSLIFY